MMTPEKVFRLILGPAVVRLLRLLRPTPPFHPCAEGRNTFIPCRVRGETRSSSAIHHRYAFKTSVTNDMFFTSPFLLHLPPIIHSHTPHLTPHHPKCLSC